MLRRQFILVCLCGLLSPAWAWHIVGGEIYYECQGNNEYIITLKIFRDCSNTQGAYFDNPAYVAVYDSNDSLLQYIEMYNPAVTNVQPTTNNPCLQIPPNICVEEGVYSEAVVLPPIAGGYHLVYQRCCRNSTIVNIQNPNSAGATYSTFIPGPPYSCNNSAYFVNFPPLGICLLDSFGFDHSAIDPDGDSLVYTFETPWTGATNLFPQPGPPPNFNMHTAHPPFIDVVYAAGYSTNYPIASNPAFTLDSQTGFLTGTPNQLGQYVMTVNAKEYWNGVLINENRRDFQFNCVSCVDNTVAIIQNASPNVLDPNTICEGLTVDFNNQSILATTYFWNFGDPTTNGDTSLLVNPTYTFPDTGQYLITLVANPGWPCADTTVKPFNIYAEIPVDFTVVSPQCITDQSFDFDVTSQHTNGAVFSWDIGGQIVNDMEPQGITFNAPGYYEVYVQVEENGCYVNEVDTVAVYPTPQLIFDDDPQEGCEPFTATFANNSIGWGPIQYQWSFSDGGSSSLESPTHTFVNAGLYSVNVAMATTEGCIDTLYSDLPQIISVLPTPKAAFDADPLVTNLYNPIINLTDQSTGSDFVQYSFGDGEESNSPNVSHTYWNEGIYTIMMVAGNDYGCSDTIYRNVEIEPEYIIFIPTAFSPNGDGLNEEWLPSVKGSLEYNLSVFDRWGKLIFETSDRDIGWNGEYNGKKATQGVYLYRIELLNFKRQVKVEEGTFKLIR